MMSASLLQSAPSKNRNQGVAPTGKERFSRQETPHPGNLVNLVHPDSDRRGMCGHTSPYTTSGGAVSKRAYRPSLKKIALFNAVFFTNERGCADAAASLFYFYCPLLIAGKGEL